MPTEADNEQCLKPLLSRRADKRICFEPPVKAVIRTKDQVVDVLIADISCSGLRFYSKERWVKGKRLLFELINDDNIELPGKIKAKVNNDYGQAENGQYVYSVKFYRLSYWYERNRIHAFVYSECNKNIL